MKKILVLAVLAAIGYQFYQHGFSFFGSKGAFDEQGKPLVVLFVGPGCGEVCDSVRSYLDGHDIAFNEIDVAGSDGAPTDNKYGVKTYPTTLVGNQEIRGNDMGRLSSVLAETYGSDVLSRREKRLMAKHFDRNGHAEVVMYATKWCPYCKKQREYFSQKNIPYREVDVEESEENTQQYNSLGASGYPLIYVGFRRFDGYHEDDLLAAIDEVKRINPKL